MGFPAWFMPSPTPKCLACVPRCPNVTLLRNSRVLKLNTSANGRSVKEVVVARDGQTETLSGDIVVVACGAANSAKLLLSSANDKHPNGLANGSDQVGRNYMFHNSLAVLAISKEPNPTFFQKTIAINDFYFGMDGFDFPMGSIQMIGKSQGEMYKGEKPLETALAPLGLLDDIALHAVDFWLCTKDLPDPNNRVSLDRAGNITLSYTEQPGAEAEALRQAEIHAEAHGNAPGPFDSPQRLSQDGYPHRGCGSSGWDLPIRQGSEEFGS
jgi:choline dehydrogenase-like flavoprotein